MTIGKRTQFAGGVYDKRPCNGEDFVKGKTYGFYLDKATNVTIRNSSVREGATPVDHFGGTIYSSENVDSLVTSNLK